MKAYRFEQLLVILAIATLAILSQAEARAQGKQAIVVLKPANADSPASGCEGSAEITYQVIYDARLNAKEEVRVLNNAASMVSRDAYDKSGKSKLRDLYALKWSNDGQLYAVSVAGQQPLLALPENMKPQKATGSQPLSSFYSVTLSGEAHDGKQKRKVDLALRSIWKIYFVNEGAAVNDSLFTHATEEASVALWEAYLQKTNNYRAAEANSKMRDALITCSRVDLGHFVDGDYRSLDRARQKATRAQSVRDDDATRQLLAEIGAAQKNVEDLRSKAEQLIKSEKWDDAIDATEPIRKYLDSWPDLDKMYRASLDASHNQHLAAGRTALTATQFEAALKDCSLAKSRLPESKEALDCVCKARTEIAVRDSKKNRQINRPKDAKELLEKQIADSECKADPRVTEELKLSKCEYGKQLYTESRQLMGLSGGATARPPQSGGRRGVRAPSTTTASSSVKTALNVKAITMENKKDFRDAREKLGLANEMCPDDDKQALLVAVNHSLSAFCVAEARKALQRNDNGTAYVYLEKAQGYTPEDGQISQMLAAAREKFQEQTRVNIGVVFSNKSGNGGAGEYLGQVASSVESAGSSAGLSNPAILEGEGAEASLRAIRAGRPLNSPTVVFFGDLLTAGARVEHNSYSVSSSYSYPNPERQQWDRNIDAKNSQLESCEKQAGKNSPNCAGIRSERDQMRAYRDRLPRSLQQSYSYSQTDFRLQGAVRMSFRSTDSISRGTDAADTLSDDVSGQCIQREGVHDNDTHGASNSVCQLGDEATYLSKMFTKVRNDAQVRALDTLRSLPSSYYRRAQTAPNKAQAVESYLRFLFLTSYKSGSEAEQAKSFLSSYDPELTTDGIMR